MQACVNFEWQKATSLQSFYLRKRALYIRTRALCIRKRALYIRTRAGISSKNPGYPQKSPVNPLLQIDRLFGKYLGSFALLTSFAEIQGKRAMYICIGVYSCQRALHIYGRYSIEGYKYVQGSFADVQGKRAMYINIALYSCQRALYIYGRYTIEGCVYIQGSFALFMHAQKSRVHIYSPIFLTKNPA